jgi:hypothetical protein
MDKGLQNKKIHIILISIFALFTPILADRIFLKNGESSIGKAMDVSATHVDWQEDRGKIRKIPLQEVERIDVGYDGVPVCTKYLNMLTESCDLILHRLTKTSAAFTTKSSPLKLEVIPLIKIISLKVNFTMQDDYSLFLSPGVVGIWEAGNFKGKASLVSVKNQSWQLLPAGKNQTIQSFPAQEMISFEILRAPTIREIVVENSPKVIPGYVQIQEKKYTKAILLLSGTLLSAAGMIYEYNQVVNAINNDREYLPTPDGRIFIVSNVLSTDRYDFHNQRFHGYAALFSIFVAYSLYDAFYVGQVESKNGNTAGVWVKPGIETMSLAKEKVYMYPTNFSSMPLQYSIQIETRF